MVCIGREPVEPQRILLDIKNETNNMDGNNNNNILRTSKKVRAMNTEGNTLNENTLKGN